MALGVGEGQARVILHDEALPIQLGVGLVDGPWRREAAGFGREPR